MLWSRTFWMRQSEGGRLRSEAESPGGKRKVVLRELFEQESSKELGEQEGPGKLRIFGRQGVELEQALEPLKDQLDLPAEAVDLQDFLGREVRSGGGREDQHVAGE